MAEIITGIDIGTAEIKVVIAENRNGHPNILSVFKERSLGLKKGAIHDLSETVQALSRVFVQIRDVSKSAVKNLYVNIGTAQVRAQHSRGVAAVSRADSEIYQDDVDRVVRASQILNLGSNRMIVHTITKEFIVDGVGDITEPIGLGGSRLEVTTLVIDAFEPHVKGLIKAIQLNGGFIKGMAFDPLIAARAALSKVQKDLGTVLVDIGHGTTGMVVYEENRLVGAAVFPVGAANITNDIAIGLKIPVAAAESIKLNYGYAVSRDVGVRDTIDLKKICGEGYGIISRRLLAEIIQARMSEILEFVQSELKLMGRSGQLAGGVVLVGGGAKLPGIADLAKDELRLAAQIGLVAERNDWFGSEGMGSVFDDPEYVNVLGLILWGGDEEGWFKKRHGFSLRQIFQRFLP
ncbi:MAG: cell division protein FtsA [Patescibacteria group bacterium]